MTTKRVQKYFARLRANKKPTGRIRRTARLIIGSLLAQSEQDRIVRLREEQRARDFNRRRNEFYARFTPGSKQGDRMVLNGEYDEYADGVDMWRGVRPMPASWDPNKDKPRPKPVPSRIR